MPTLESNTVRYFFGYFVFCVCVCKHPNSINISIRISAWPSWIEVSIRIPNDNEIPPYQSRCDGPIPELANELFIAFKIVFSSTTLFLAISNVYLFYLCVLLAKFRVNLRLRLSMVISKSISDYASASQYHKWTPLDDIIMKFTRIRTILTGKNTYKKCFILYTEHGVRINRQSAPSIKSSDMKHELLLLWWWLWSI